MRDRGFGWDLPPGCPGPHREAVEVRCVNPGCESYGNSYELDGTWDMGGVFLDNEDDVKCPDCGWERSDEWHDYYPIVETDTGDPALVSIHDDVAIVGLSPSALKAIKPVLKQDYEERMRQLKMRLEGAGT